MLGRRVRELEQQNEALRSVLRDLIVDDPESAVEMRIRLSAVREFAEELSAQGFGRVLDAKDAVDAGIGTALDSVGDRLRLLLDAPLCTCGECEE